MIITRHEKPALFPSTQQNSLLTRYVQWFSYPEDLTRKEQFTHMFSSDCTESEYDDDVTQGVHGLSVPWYIVLRFDEV